MLLSDPVTTIPLVGKNYANRLKKLGIETIEDLLHHYPFRYEDFSQFRKISELRAGETVTIKVQVLKIENVYTKYGKRLTKAVVADETGELRVVWFNQPYLIRNIKRGDLINLSGRLSEFDRKPAFVSPEYEILNASNLKSKTIHTGRLVPIYPETHGITSKWLRSRINVAIQPFNHLAIEEIEFLPDEVRARHNLVDLKSAINQIHFPRNQTEIDEAKKRLAFDELFLMQLQALKRRADWQKKPLAKKFSILNFQFSIQKFIDSLPFKLTNAQTRAIDEILKDLSKDVPMNRLLEGDVGSGKTIVATVAIYATYLNGFQSALMAPTEVLAEQHYKTISELLEPFGVKVALRTGSHTRMSANEKRMKANKRILDHSCKLAKDSLKFACPNVIIGTHALLFDNIKFSKLGLVVIDEQHRFGVEQRGKLLKKAGEGRVPHLLTMTATPIPRSLALTLYGDLDLSVLDEMPPGRKKVITWVVPNHKRQAAYNWVRKQILQSKARRPTPEEATVKASGEKLESSKETTLAGTISDGGSRLGTKTQPSRADEGVGRGLNTQAFVICPLIEESKAETMQSVRAATAEFERLSKEVFPDLKLALLHGKVKPKEKNKILTDFKNGKYDILVSTQVVEVGIDIPTATLMIIEGAERFGLASLHQLRGRVGRSDRQSYCLLFTESKSPRALNRLKAMEELNDGFKLAEIDLKMRGPGEIYGVKQHGLMHLKIASLSDVKLIETTRNEAKKLLEEDPKLSKYPNLKAKLERMGSDLVEPN